MTKKRINVAVLIQFQKETLELISGKKQEYPPSYDIHSWLTFHAYKTEICILLSSLRILPSFNNVMVLEIVYLEMDMYYQFQFLLIFLW